MAQMRVKDQDLIVEQVVKKIETTELSKFKARDDVQAIQDVIETRIEVITKLKKEVIKLQETITANHKELEVLVKEFQEANVFDSYDRYWGRQGIQLSGTWGAEIPSYEVCWELPRNKQNEISTKLRLQTMSGNFDVYKLIEELTAEFTS